MANSGERTEKATAKRRQQATDDGQFPYSAELTSAMTLAVTFSVLFYLTGPVTGFRSFLESVLAVAAKGSEADALLISVVRDAGQRFLLYAAPFFGAAFLAALAGNIVQGAPRPPAQAGTLRWEHLNPVRGLSRLKARFSWLEWLKIVLLVGVTLAVLWTTLDAFWERVVTLPLRDVSSSYEFLMSLTRRVAGYLVGFVIVLGAGDYFLQRWRFEKNIMQTKAEVKEDAKAMDGNPTVKRHIRSKQREQAMRRMMKRLKAADVIVTNPTHYAVALEYKPQTMAAPRVVAKGRDKLAQRIKRLGRIYDIPTVENVTLARALYRSVELEQEIPGELFKAVAEVLAYVYRIRKAL